jgi:hypothetical protein
MTAYGGQQARKKERLMTTDQLLERLRSLWNTESVYAVSNRVNSTETHTKAEPRTCEVLTPRSAKVAMSNLKAVRLGGVSVRGCKEHLLPFDAIEITDIQRPGWVRSTCRLCGRFLGYRLESIGILLKERS